MKKVFLTYADSSFEKQKKMALLFARLFGGFDQIIGSGPEDIDEDFKNKHAEILSQPRGGGYWLWKPYMLFKTFSELDYGDYLFYSDAGAIILKNIDALINELNQTDQDIMGFELPLIEEQWTKPELFINLDCNSKVYSKSNQIMASFILLKKSTSSELFLKNFLNYACNELNITDIRDNSIQPSNCFLDHRHDQSIFSLLYKKNNLRVFKDPTQFGNLNYLWKYSGLREKFIPVVGTILLENGRYLSVKKYPQSYGTILYHSRSTDRKTLLKLLVKYLIKNSHKQLTSYRKTLTI